MKCINCNRLVKESENGLVHQRLEHWPELIHCLNETEDEIVIGQYADVKIDDLAIYQTELVIIPGSTPLDYKNYVNESSIHLI